MKKDSGAPTGSGRTVISDRHAGTSGRPPSRPVQPVHPAHGADGNPDRWTGRVREAEEVFGIIGCEPYDGSRSPGETISPT